MFHFIFPELCCDHITSCRPMALAFRGVTERKKMGKKANRGNFLKSEGGPPHKVCIGKSSSKYFP